MLRAGARGGWGEGARRDAGGARQPCPRPSAPAHTSGLWSAPSIYRAAICDCTEALSLSAGHAKALYRRARARLALASAPLAKAGSAEQAEMLSGALADFDALLAAEPSHREARRWRARQHPVCRPPLVASGCRTAWRSSRERWRVSTAATGGRRRHPWETPQARCRWRRRFARARSSLLRLSVGVAVLAAVTALGVTCLEPGRAVSEIVAARGGAEGATAGMP